MNAAVLMVALGVALAGITIALNNVSARLAVVELTLNEGLPPGHEKPQISAQSVSSAPAVDLGLGVHIFVSRTCHACQRLLEELDASPPSLDGPLHLRHVDRPRPIAKRVALASGAELHTDNHDLAAAHGADPLPYVIAVGPHGLSAARVAPTTAAIASIARDAGIGVRP